MSVLPAEGPWAEFFTVMKIFRLVRIFKLARSIEAFRVLLLKMGRAFALVFPFLVVLFFFLFLVAVVAMQLFAGMFDDKYVDARGKCCDPSSLTSLSSEACAIKPRYHFDSFGFSFLTTFQVCLSSTHLFSVRQPTPSAVSVR